MAFTYNKSNLLLLLLTTGIFTEKYIEICIILFVNIIVFLERGKFCFGKKISLFFLTILSLSSIVIYLNKYSFSTPFLQYTYVLLYALLYYNAFQYLYRKGMINLLFEKYLFVAKTIAILGLIQFIVYFFTNVNIFGFIYDYAKDSYVVPRITRITSIVDEPGYLALLLTPAITYYYLSNSKNSKFYERFIIYVTFFLTFGTASYLIFIVIFVYKHIFLKPNTVTKYLFIISLCIMIPITMASLVNMQKQDGIFSSVTKKFSDTFNAFSEMDPYVFENLNLSSYSTMVNIWVAINAPSRILGTGIGTHEQNYTALYQSDFQYYGLNKEDGYSLFNRIFSEFGIIGIGGLFFYLWKFHNKRNIVNLSAFFFILTLCIRGGNYVRYGTVFFFFLYYYSSLSNYINDNEKTYT